MKHKPILTIIAGPNGAGKSSFTRNAMFPGDLIDPEAIARTICPDDPASVAGAAGREALNRASAFVARQANFVQETTMSGNSTARLIERAKAVGYLVDLRYVGVASATLSKMRVAKRAATGGHAVPADDVARRYQRSMDALPGILAKVDTATLYDNSNLEPHRIVATFAGGRFTAIEPDCPEWAKTAITSYKESLS